MGVDLGRTEAGVAEEALDVADVDAGLDQLGCCGVAQHVGCDVSREAGCDGSLGEPGSHRGRGEWLVMEVDEEMGV